MKKPIPVCDRINIYRITNDTAVIYGFEGIPQNFTINIVVSFILFLLFCFLRKNAWNHGRIALLTKNHRRENSSTGYNIWKTVTQSEKKENEEIDYESDEKTYLRRASVIDPTSQFDKGFFSWLKFFYVVSDKDIREKSGTDAYQYLVFQKYLIFTTFIITVISLTVILPVNMHGNGTKVKYNDFATTTILNLSSYSKMIWVHAVLSFLYFFGIIVIIWHFATTLQITTIQEVSNTLIVDGIPKDSSFRSIVLDHFKEAYPECEINDIQFAHNMRKLIHLNLQREIAIHARYEASQEYINTGVRRTMVPKFCGRFHSCCIEEVDVIDYYNDEILIIEAQCQKEIVKAYDKKIGVAFVTFETAEDARKVLEDYHSSCYMLNYPQTSSMSNDIKSDYWTISYAPPSNVINWENLCHPYKKWLIKAIFINLILFIFLFILTTPTYALNVLQLNFQSKKISMNVVLNRFLPSFIMWAVSTLLPFIVYYSEVLIGHWTKTDEHTAVIIKTYSFLIVMVLILPSLGIASLPSFVNWLFSIQNIQLNVFYFHWLCIFAPGNCAFFVNYIITAAFIGTTSELIRIPELIIYLYYQVVVRSSVEMWGIRKNVVWEFQFGLCYSWILCVFTVTVTYSFVCPLITPFGLIYIIFKYAVDRYNIYFAYERSFINSKIHRLAMSFTVFAFLLLQINLLIYLNVNKVKSNLVYIFMFVCCILSLMLFLFFTFYGWFTQVKTKETHEKFGQLVLPSTPLMPSLLATLNMMSNTKE